MQTKFSGKARHYAEFAEKICLGDIEFTPKPTRLFLNLHGEFNALDHQLTKKYTAKANLSVFDIYNFGVWLERDNLGMNTWLQAV